MSQALPWMMIDWDNVFAAVMPVVPNHLSAVGNPVKK